MRKKTENVEEVVQVRAPIQPSSLPRPPLDSPMAQVKPTINAAFRKSIDELIVTKDASTKDSANDSDVIAVGTTCKNSGCTVSYQSEDSKYTECVHHPGVPIFHEGMKYWSCCQRKTSDFSVFVAQKGCETGTHKWKAEETNDQVVNCRYDWHQTGNNVVVAIYAKMYDYRVSYVQLNPIRLRVHLVFPQQNNATFDLDLELRGIIDVQKTTVQMMGTKVEITMCKAELGSWAKLNFPAAQVVSEQEVSLDELQIKPETAANETNKDHDSDSDVDLDDVGPVYQSAKITEITDDE